MSCSKEEWEAMKLPTEAQVKEMVRLKEERFKHFEVAELMQNRPDYANTVFNSLEFRGAK